MIESVQNMIVREHIMTATVQNKIESVQNKIKSVQNKIVREQNKIVREQNKIVCGQNKIVNVLKFKVDAIRVPELQLRRIFACFDDLTLVLSEITLI